MRLPKVLDPAARDYRVRYATATILRGRLANEGAFRNCLELEDADDVIRIILRRGLKNGKLRTALQGSQLVNLWEWPPHPELIEAYYAPEPEFPGQKRQRPRRKRLGNG